MGLSSRVALKGTFGHINVPNVQGSVQMDRQSTNLYVSNKFSEFESICNSCLQHHSITHAYQFALQILSLTFKNV